MTKITRKVIIKPLFGPFMGVYYPHRKTPDVYVAMKDKPVFCCQCEQEFPLNRFPEHIEGHDRRNKKKERDETV